MTEGQWLACGNPEPLLGFLQAGGKLSGRKARLFAVAVCRCFDTLLADSKSRDAVEVAERFADGIASGAELQAAREAFRDWSVTATYRSNAAWATTSDQAGQAAYGATRHAAAAFAFGGAASPTAQEVVALLRDVFGNPICPVTSNPVWLTPTVVSLAQAVYDERTLPLGVLDSIRLGILADALEDAGCTDDNVLAHLRSPGLHMRGCWALDLVLDKS